LTKLIFDEMNSPNQNFGLWSAGVRFVRYQIGQTEGLAIEKAGVARGLMATDRGYPGHLDTSIRKGQPALVKAANALNAGHPIDLTRISRLPPLRAPEKVICVGLNYREHSAESGFKQPEYPTLFSRFNSSLIGDGAPIVRPRAPDKLDFEGELAAIIGKGGRNIPLADALDHVIGYSIFNDGSIRDYQFKTPQWTIGKNFDDTGAFGPVLVTADELPAGCKGLRLQTRLNGEVVQSASISDMVFDVATLVAIISEAITLRSGDVIVTGTPSGVGVSRKPPLFLKAGDTVEVEIEKIGVLINPIVDET
jgi:acylpyruvate hydrolase